MSRDLVRRYGVELLVIAALGYQTYRTPSAFHLILFSAFITAIAWLHLKPLGETTARGIYMGSASLGAGYLAMVGFVVWQLSAGPLWVGLLMAAMTVYIGVLLVPAIRSSLRLAALIKQRPSNPA